MQNELKDRGNKAFSTFVFAILHLLLSNVKTVDRMNAFKLF
jgi:hypothetical protein